MSLLDSLGRALLGPQISLRRCDVTAAGSAEAVLRPLIEALKALQPAETRPATTDRYFEGVITRDRLAEFCAALEAALGTPVKPFGARPGFDADLEALIDSHGGIEKDQCLYLRGYTGRGDEGKSGEGESDVVFGALWPWSNGKSITLKVGIYD